MSDFVIHLPSNVQPQRFPLNSASNYSTQLDWPVDLEGDWEVALTEVSYPKSVKLFQDEGITFVKSEHAPMCGTGGKTMKKRIHLDKQSPQALAKLLSDIAPLIFTVTYENDAFVLNVHLGYYLVHIPQKLQLLMGFTTRDFIQGTYHGKKLEKEIPKERALIKVLDINCMEREEVTVKEEGVSVKTVKELRALLKKNLTNTGIDIKVTNGIVHMVKKSSNRSEDLAVILNQELREALNLTQWKAVSHRGTYPANKRLMMNQVAKSKGAWAIVVHKKKMIEGSMKQNSVYWKVPSPRVNTMDALLVVLNEKSEDYDYHFRHKNGVITLTLKSDVMEIQLDKALADILGFVRTHFSERKTYRALWSPALNRNIDYVFIYSNICDYVNVGHMTAPLIHAVPFMKDGHGPLVHHAIRTPIYRPISVSKLARIDLRLCDGNGNDIPFIDGKTLIVLNLRRRIL